MAKEISMDPNQLRPQIDLKNTTKYTSPDGGEVFQEGFILRKVSKFLTNTGKDGIIPIPVFYNIKTGKPLSETIPEEIKSEYED